MWAWAVIAPILRATTVAYRQLAVFRGTPAAAPFDLLLETRRLGAVAGTGRLRRSSTVGWCDGTTICLYLHPGGTLPQYLTTLLHEMVHLSGKLRHDADFRSLLIDAAAEAWQLHDGEVAELRTIRRYQDLDDRLEWALSCQHWWCHYARFILGLWEIP